jgi:hypothetical protein
MTHVNIWYMKSKRCTSKTWIVSGRDTVFGIPAEIQSGHLPNTSQKRYRLSKVDDVHVNEIVLLQRHRKGVRCKLGRFGGISVGLNNDPYNDSFITIPYRFDSAFRVQLSYRWS